MIKMKNKKHQNQFSIYNHIKKIGSYLLYKSPLIIIYLISNFEFYFKQK